MQGTASSSTGTSGVLRLMKVRINAVVVQNGSERNAHIEGTVMASWQPLCKGYWGLLSMRSGCAGVRHAERYLVVACMQALLQNTPTSLEELS